MTRIPDAGRIELRLADGGANPYLPPPAVLVAGLDGVKHPRDPGKRLDINMYSEGDKAKNAKRLPLDMLDAFARTRESRRCSRRPSARPSSPPTSSSNTLVVVRSASRYQSRAVRLVAGSKLLITPAAVLVGRNTLLVFTMLPMRRAS